MRKISLFLVGVFLLLLSGNLFAQSPTRGEVGYSWNDIHAIYRYTITSTSPAEVSIEILQDPTIVDEIPTTVEDNEITYDVVEIVSIGDAARYLVVPESIKTIDCLLNDLLAIKFECTYLPTLPEFCFEDLYWHALVISVPEGRREADSSAIYPYTNETRKNIRYMEGGIPYTEQGNFAFLWLNKLQNGSTSASVVGINSDITEAIIPQTITGLGTDPTEEYTVSRLDLSAFDSYSSLKKVVLPESINYIQANAFYNCQSLEYINIPYNVRDFGSYCFEEMHTDTLYFAGQYAGDEDAFLGTEVKNLILPASRRSSINSLTMQDGLVYDTVTVEGAWNYVTFENENNPPRHAVVFKNNAYFYDGSTMGYQEAPLFWENKPVYVEKDLTIDEFSLIGNIGGATNYNFIESNAGDNSRLAHSMVALPFYYAGNSWGVDADGNGAINGTNTPVSYGESFFVYPTTNQYNTNGTTINGDTYTTLRQEIPYTNLKLDDFTVSLTNNNTTKWFALSNPFIGKLNLSKFYTSNSSALQSTYAYVWDNTEHDWVALDGINTTNKYALYPATGILIEGASANATATFNFNVADIVKTETITTTKTAQANRVEFTATSNDVEMKMYAHIDENSDNGYGRMDASVLFSNKEDAVNPYFALEGRNIFDNYFSELPATFDVNFNAYKSNTIDFALTQGMEDVEVTLIDIANANAETVLNANEPVTINVTAGQNEGRYQLRFSKKNVGINEVASEESSIQIWNNNSEVSINGKDLKRVEIFNTLGQRVYLSSLVGESTTFDSNLNAGAYIVKVYTANSSKSEKIIIR